MSVIILTAVLSCLNSAFYVSSRVLFILADRGDAPQVLVKLNARRVPVVSVLIGAAAGFLGIIAATEAPQEVFDFLVSSSGALIVFVYMIICVAQIALRRRRERAGEAAPAGQHVAVPLLELRGDRRHGRRADRHGVHARPAAGFQRQLHHPGGGRRRLSRSCSVCGSRAPRRRP